MATEQFSFSNYGQFLAEGPYAGYVQERRTAGAGPIHMARRVAQPGRDHPDPATSDLVLNLIARGEGIGRCDFGAGRFQARCRSGVLALAPAHTGCNYFVSHPSVVLTLCFPVAALRPVLEGAAGVPAAALAGDFGPLHARAWRDPSVEQLCLRLWEEAEADNPYGGLFAGGALVALAAALLRLSGRPHAPERCRGGLAPWRLRRVLDQIEAHLGEDLRLADLAAHAGLSPWHFCTAFRQSTSVPPHQWQRERRMARAKSLLADTRLPLAEIALAVGYANQSGFGTAFRRVVGVSPGAWRREHLS